MKLTADTITDEQLVSAAAGAFEADRIEEMDAIVDELCRRAETRPSKPARAEDKS